MDEQNMVIYTKEYYSAIKRDGAVTKGLEKGRIGTGLLSGVMK
jgi:hypothetical protein